LADSDFPGPGIRVFCVDIAFLLSFTKKKTLGKTLHRKLQKRLDRPAASLVLFKKHFWGKLSKSELLLRHTREWKLVAETQEEKSRYILD
jgi:hypothetical protein